MLHRPFVQHHRRQLLDFFTRALAEAEASKPTFQVLSTSARSRWLQTGTAAAQLPSPSPPTTVPGMLIILDSSFNPPTWAHFHMATSAIRALAPYKEGVRRSDQVAETRVLLLLAVNNADKAPEPAPFDHRLCMMRAFAQDLSNSLLEVDISIDIGVTTQPYFYDKSAAIAESEFYAGKPKQVILTGYDTLIRILDPKYYSSIGAALGPLFDRASMRVTMRADADWGSEQDQREYVHGLLHGDGLTGLGGDRGWARKIELFEGRRESKMTSSTLAREAAATQDCERLGRIVPPAVKDWVEQEGLYVQ